MQFNVCLVFFFFLVGFCSTLLFCILATTDIVGTSVNSITLDRPLAHTRARTSAHINNSYPSLHKIRGPCREKGNNYFKVSEQVTSPIETLFSAAPPLTKLAVSHPLQEHARKAVHCTCARDSKTWKSSPNVHPQKNVYSACFHWLNISCSVNIFYSYSSYFL